MLVLDRSVLTYEQMIRRWLDDPRVASYPSPRDTAQYRTAIFAQDAAQAVVARRLVAESGKAVPVVEAAAWHDAEEWHQHFLRDANELPE